MAKTTDDAEIHTDIRHQTDEQAFDRFMQRMDSLTDGLPKPTDDAAGMQLVIARLDRIITALEKPRLTPEQTLWSSEQIANWLGASKQTIEARVVTRPGFPTALRAVDSKQAQRRWFASDVMEWARTTAGTLPASRPGRRRKAA
ncbi:hypothetical protein [Paraburkholderia diazotrophica]|uniref:Uncharacterized protein n=1 Tax=Paraburkholderia diazotrophica TaxID=667676 RepID=A0A1H6TR84_9BURK|nr:hypothetical protein [Paraburkholderia diazotrophica]SEI81776.1 hypothetical protein SAMN05192539_1004202 [Paraburkholderia diazotrophica]